MIPSETLLGAIALVESEKISALGDPFPVTSVGGEGVGGGDDGIGGRGRAVIVCVGCDVGYVLC